MYKIIRVLFNFPLIVHMKLFLFIITWYPPLMVSIRMVHGQSISCSCHLDETNLALACDNVNSLIAFQQCLHEQLHLQSNFNSKRGELIRNLTIRYHRLYTLSGDLLQFSYGNIYYRLNNLRYLYIVHGTLQHIEDRALILIEQTLEYFDLSYNKLRAMPTLRNNNKESSNLAILVLSHNRIQYLKSSDIQMYSRLQELDLSFNRLRYIDMSIINSLNSLRKLFLNSNMLKTLTNNAKFPNNFHLKLNSNPLECDCRLRWLRYELNRVQYPIYHDEPRCEMPRALADKKIVILRDEQFVCGPIISKPELRVHVASTGELTTLRCDVYSDPAPEVWWTFQNKIIGKMISAINGPDIRAGSYTIRYSCLSRSSLNPLPKTCLNKTTTLTISNIGTEHNGTYNCVAAIRNQGRSDNEYLSYELRVRQTSLIHSSFLLWMIGLFLFLTLFLAILLCFCCFIRCHRSSQHQAERNKALLFDRTNNYKNSLLANGNVYNEKMNEAHCSVKNGIYNLYDIVDSRSQLGPPMYSEVRIPNSTPLRSIGGSVSSTLLRQNDPFYDSNRSDRQFYEQTYRKSPLESAVADEFEDEMIFPTGYEEDYQYREDIIKPNQAPDPRRQAKVQHTNHDRFDSVNTSRFNSYYKSDKSKYKHLVESQL